MAKVDLSRLWYQFLDAAKCGTEEGGNLIYKVGLCKVALNLSNKLIECGYDFGDQYDLWKEHFDKVFFFLEGDDDMIQRTVREYFLGLHSGEITDFSIYFAYKTEGTSVGTICNVMVSGISRRFYIKCHQRNPRSTSVSIANRHNSANGPFVQEIFVYQLLSLIKVGGEVHFPLPITFKAKNALYIATEEINFTIAEELTAETLNFNVIILVNFLEYFLRLEDIGRNERNYGQSDEGEAVIVDFWITLKDNYELSDSQISEFWSELYETKSEQIPHVLKIVTKEERKEIIYGAIEKWNLMNAIEQAKSIVEEFLFKNRERLETSGDLSRYVRDVKSNVEKLLK